MSLHPFKVSDKVLYVNEKFKSLPFNVIFVVEIADFWAGHPGVKLIGVGSPHPSGCWDAFSFRKLEDIKRMNKESRAEGILHHRRKLQPIVLRDDTTTHQDRVNAARDHGLLRLLNAMDCGMKTFKGGIRNE